MRKKNLSIIIATYNSEETVAKTFDSILLQSLNDIEVIVVDGKSQDKTVELLKLYEKKFVGKGIGYTWICEKDSGIYDAWNKGLKIANGKWVSFIGSDDFLYKNALIEMGSIADKFSKLDFISARAKIVLNGELVREFGKPWRWSEFKKEMKVLHAGGWHNSEYFREYGVFDSSYKITGDYEILLRAKSNLKTAFCKDFIIEMGAGGASDDNIFNALKEACKAKVRTAKRPTLIAQLEMYFIYFKITIIKAFR